MRLHAMNEVMTKDEFDMVLPKDMQGRVDDRVMDTINKMLSEEGMAEAYRENLISYTRVMSEGKFKIDSYVKAVKYCTFKLLGDTNHLAFTRTFPDKMAQWKAEGKAQKEVARYTTAYNQSKLVTLIMEQARMPTHILNADVFQEAINVQAQIMADEDVSPKVRSDAANSLLTHLKAPETKKIELDVGIKNNDVMEELRAVTQQFAKMQEKQILDGEFSVKDIAESRIISVSEDG